MSTIEKMCMAFQGDYGGEGVPCGWDNMLDEDKPAMIKAMRAALLVLSNPEAISEGMVIAFGVKYADIHREGEDFVRANLTSRPEEIRFLRDAIAASLSAAVHENEG